MDQSALVAEQIEAGHRFLRELEKSIRVVVAFWHRDGADARWYFYVASDRFPDDRIGPAFAEVLRIARERNDPNFDPFQVRLVGLSDAPVRAALDFYATRPPKIPARLRDRRFAGVSGENIYFVQGPTGVYTMPSGREVLDQIIDEEARFYEKNDMPPRKMKLPVLMAYDLSKCGRNEIGDLSGRVFMEGIVVFEKEGFHGMKVEIVRDRNAVLELE